MFNKDKQHENENVKKLKDRITELEGLLNQIANDNGSIIVKQLPDGTIELNGLAIDNDSEVEYYNSAQATYGELTMFRIGKEAKQREMDKLTSMHMDEIDNLTTTINKLQDDIRMLQNKSDIDDDTIHIYKQSEIRLNKEITDIKEHHEEEKILIQAEKQQLIERYEGLINGLEEDIQSWKERYLKINNITLDGTIITKYGKVLGN